MSRLKVCIVGLKCYDHIAGASVPRYLGGIETQLVVLAKGLSTEGADVSLITYDHGQKDRQSFEGITELKSHPPGGGVPGLRWVSRSRRLWRAMRHADAAIYLQMGAGTETGQVALGSRRAGGSNRRFVFCMASDANFGPHLSAGRLGWEGKVYRYGLRHAHLIVAQTLRQQEGLQSAMRLPSQVIPMAARCPLEGHPQGTESPAGAGRVLWIGRIIPGKRFEWLLETARRCPEVAFDVVGSPNRDSAYARDLLDLAAGVPNVKVHGRLAASDLIRVYREARVVCCTSTLEGFPTTFIEAWSCGIPVVTTFDPDATVARHGLGRVAATVDELAGHLRTLMGDDAIRSAASAASRAYYLNHHTVQAVSRRFLAAFERLLASGPQDGGFKSRNGHAWS